MTNKYLRFNTLALLALATLGTMSSCDDIDEVDRITSGKAETVVIAPDTLTVEFGGETFTYVDEHKLLIEDFTGWNCVNCPTLAEFLTTQITSSYPSVLVSLHMNTNSFSARHRDGYNCASADSIADYIIEKDKFLAGNTTASGLPLPSVTIDQTANDDGRILDSNQNLLSKLALNRFSACNIDKSAPQAGIGINVSNQGNGKFGISTYVKYNGPCNLKLWLIEEELRSSRQNSSSGYLKDYLNHGILRMVINGAYSGDDLTLNGDGEVVAHHTLNIADKMEGDKGWNPVNCRVVAILTDPATRQVINCNEVELAPEAFRFY